MSTPGPQFRNLLLTRWKTYHPTMYQELVQANMLDAAALQLDELLYTLVVEQQMEYSAAWGIAIEQSLLPEEDSDSTS